MQDPGLTKAVAIYAAAVSKVFGSGADEVQALREASLDIRENEFFTLLGPSGCGKTTLLRLIAGLDEPSAGHIELHGRALTGLPPYRRPVNTVCQSYALFPHLSVARNVSFGLEMLGTGAGAIDTRVREMLVLVRLGELANRKPAQLSGGQQQRVALARALANHSKVLLLDEPLSVLDLKLRKDMQLELKRLQAETGITFIFVTHDQEEALTMSDRLAVLSGYSRVFSCARARAVECCPRCAWWAAEARSAPPTRRSGTAPRQGVADRHSVGHRGIGLKPDPHGASGRGTSSLPDTGPICGASADDTPSLPNPDRRGVRASDTPSSPNPDLHSHPARSTGTPLLRGAAKRRSSPLRLAPRHAGLARSIPEQ